MLQNALKYISQGKAVFPVVPRGKTPLSMHGHKDASKNEAQVRKRWPAGLDANIGLVCSPKNNLCVLDIDPRNGGNKSLVCLVEKYGPFPETVEVLTGGGGRHYYFQYDERFGVEGEFSKGIDCKKNGYVVAPPSIHPSGRAYVFVEGRALGDIPIAKAPEWLLKGAERGQKQPITELFKGVPEGGRNNALARITGTLISLGLDPSECRSVALTVNKSYDPPLEEEEVLSVVESIWRTHGRDGCDLAGVEGPVLEALTDFLNRDIPPVEYWIRDIIKKKGRTLISAQTNMGKSILAQHIALTVAAGAGPFLGKFDIEKTNVLYLDWEMGESVNKERFQKMTSEVGIPKGFYLGSMLGEDILDETVKGNLEKKIVEWEIKLLVLDPIGSAWSGDELSLIHI